MGGKDPEAINLHDCVLIDVVGRISKDKFDITGPIFQESKSWMVIVGAGDVLPCIEMAVRFMQTGETSRVWSHSKYALGPGTRNYTVNNADAENNITKETRQVPPHSSVMYEVKVTMLVMDTSRLNPYFTIQKATSRKTMANEIYQYEWCKVPEDFGDPQCYMAMTRAIRLYSKSAKEMETLLNGTYFAQVEEDHPQRQQAKQLLLDCLNNVVAVHLRQQEYHTAKQAAIEALKHDSRNIKALLRAAKAALYDPASTLEEVNAALHSAEVEITYKNPSEEKQLKQLKAEFKRKRHEYKEQSKAMFGDMLQKASNAYKPPTDPNAENHDDNVNSRPPKKNVSFDESTTATATKRSFESHDDDDYVLKKLYDVGFWVRTTFLWLLSFLFGLVPQWATKKVYGHQVETKKKEEETVGGGTGEG